MGLKPEEEIFFYFYFYIGLCGRPIEVTLILGIQQCISSILTRDKGMKH